VHGSVYDHVDGSTAERQTDAGEDEPFDSNREHSSVCQDENLEIKSGLIKRLKDEGRFKIVFFYFHQNL